MRQHLTDEKVHYKLYKDGKNWVAASIATGIAIPVALFSAAFLSPIQGVQATSSDDPNNAYILKNDSVINAAIKSGQFYDATENGSATIDVQDWLLQDIVKEGYILTVKDNRWEISAPASKKVDLNSVLSQMNLPSAGADLNTMLASLASDGVLTMNGGNEEPGNGYNVYNGIANTLVSGDGIVTKSDTRLANDSVTKKIGNSPYTAVVSGPLTGSGNGWGAHSYKTLIADGGTVQGINSLPSSLSDIASQYDFTDGSMTDALAAIKSAVETINQNIVAENVPTSDPLQLDFSTAPRDASGNYIFAVDASKIGNNVGISFVNKQAYDGSNVIVEFTGQSGIDFSQGGAGGQLATAIATVGKGKLFFSVPNGQSVKLTNVEDGGLTFLAPNSDIITSYGEYSGIIGSFNGTADPSTPLNPGGDGYQQPTDGGDTLTPTDDPGTKIDTTKTPTTPTSKAVTVNQTISTSVSNAGNINPSDIEPDDLPTDTQTKSTSFTATVKDDGTVSYTNADGSVHLDAPFDDVPAETTTTIGGTTYTVQVTGTLTDNSGLDEDTLDAKAVTDQIGQATDGTTLNWNIAVVYFPSSTSKSGHIDITDHVYYDFDDNDGDESLLPADYDRKATLTYTETTDSNGNKSYSNWAVKSGFPTLVVPEIAGYTAGTNDDVTNDGLLQMVQSAENPMTMQTMDTDVIYTIIDTSVDNTVTRTVKFETADGTQIADPFTDSVTFTTKTLGTDTTTTPDEAVLSGTTTTFKGYHLVDDPENLANATLVSQDEHIDETTPSENITLLYAEDDPTVNTDTVTRTVHFVDEDGNQVKDDLVETVSVSESTDPVTGKVTSELGTFSGLDLTVPNYRLDPNPSYTSVNTLLEHDQQVEYDDAGLEYTVHYQLSNYQTTVTETVHLQDENGNALTDKDGNAIADPADQSFTFDVKAQYSGFPTYAHTSDSSDPQSIDELIIPEVNGYTYTRYTYEGNLGGARSPLVARNVHFNDGNVDIVLIYTKNKPTIADKFVTQTINYVDQNGDPIKTSTTRTLHFESSTDAVTGAVTYTSDGTTFDGYTEDALTIKGYDLVTNADLQTAETTQTVSMDSADEKLTLVYTKQPNAIDTVIVTRTVNFVDESGQTTWAPVTQTIKLTSSTDPTNDKTTFTPETGTFTATDLTKKGYTIDLEKTAASDKANAETDGTVKFGDPNESYTIYYTKQADVTANDTITRTVHFVDQNGKEIKTAVQTVDLSSSTDPATDVITFTPEVGTFKATDLTIKGYDLDQANTDQSQETAAETAGAVKFGDPDEAYTIHYIKQANIDNTDTITRIVHFVDENGTEIKTAVQTVDLSSSTDPATDVTTYDPEVGNFEATDLTVKGYDIDQGNTDQRQETAAKTAGTVKFGDPDEDYTIHYTKQANIDNTETITRTVHFVDENGKEFNTVKQSVDLSSSTDPATDATTYTPESGTFTATDLIVKGYDINQTKTKQIDETTAETEGTVKFGDADQDLTIYYTKQANVDSTDTITRTVHFVDQNGKEIKTAVQTVDLSASTDPATDVTTYTPEVGTFKATDLTIKGYDLDQANTDQSQETAAKTAGTVKFGDPDEDYTIHYTKQANVTASDTITRTVHFVDQNGTEIKTAVQTVDLSASTDPATDVTTYDPEVGTFKATDLTVKGYDLDQANTDQSQETAAETDGTVKFGDPDEDYTIHYTKQANVNTTDTITRTVHFVDGEGQTLKADVVQSGTITQSTDPATDESTYTAEGTDFAGINTDVTGFHVVSTTGGTTDAETVQFGDPDQDVTVTYAADPATQDTIYVTKTVHFQFEDGTQAAPDQQETVTFTRSTDDRTGEVLSILPGDDVLAGITIPTIANASVTTADPKISEAQTVTSETPNAEYTVVYTDDTEDVPKTITKTVHYQFSDGSKAADDAQVTATFTLSTDKRTGKVLNVTSADDVLDQIADPAVANASVVKDDIEELATTDQTVDSDAEDVEYTVTYAHDTEAAATKTITKTVHYRNEDGSVAAPDRTTTVTYTGITDLYTGVTTYTTTDNTLAAIENPTVENATVVEDDGEKTATTEQAVDENTSSFDVTVRYQDDTNSETVPFTKTVHYVDGAGNPVAADGHATAEFTKTTDLKTGAVTYTAIDDTLEGIANPDVENMHVVEGDSAEATTAQRLEGLAAGDETYTVVYADNSEMTPAQVIKTVHYVNEAGDPVAADGTATATFNKITDLKTGVVTYTPLDETLEGIANPDVENMHVADGDSAQATTAQTVENDLGGNVDYTVVYADNLGSTPVQVTKTVHYVNEAGDPVAADGTATATFNKITDAKTGVVTYTPLDNTLEGIANPDVENMHVSQDNGEATSSQTIENDLGGNVDYTVVYSDNLKSTPVHVTKTVHYVDETGDPVAVDGTATATFNQITDAKTGVVTYTPIDNTLEGIANPDVENMHVSQDNGEATSSQTLENNLGGNVDYTVVYGDNLTTTPVQVKKTVHYVDEAGDPVAADGTATATFNKITDAKTGVVTYTPIDNTLEGIANPDVENMHVSRDNGEATSSQTIHSDKEGNKDYTVVYADNLTSTPVQVTKTVHYVDEAGDPVAVDATAIATFNKTTDTKTGVVTYTPIDDTLDGIANPDVENMHVSRDNGEATSSQTVENDLGGNVDYTVVYADNLSSTPVQVTKTVHYVDKAGDPVAADGTATATFNKITDAKTGVVTYTPIDNTLEGIANPDVENMHVSDGDSAKATTAQTVENNLGGNVDYTVVYTDNSTSTPVQVTKTVHYVNEAGDPVAADGTATATFNKITDAKTGVVTYTPIDNTLEGISNPDVENMHVKTDNGEATSSQTVENDLGGNVDYTVVYADNLTSTPVQVTKTVHYVDEAGDPVAADGTATATFNKITDAKTGVVTYTPIDDTLEGISNPEVLNMHVSRDNGEATSSQTVENILGGNVDYTVVYSDNLTSTPVQVTKTVHYVDEAGDPVAADGTATATFNKTTDAKTGVVTYTPLDDTLEGITNPDVENMHVSRDNGEATTAQTVENDLGGNVDYTVVYSDNLTSTPVQVTKTVHYVDEAGDPVAADGTATATFNKTTDAKTGVVTYTPLDNTLEGITNPDVENMHVSRDNGEATSSQTIENDLGGNVDYTVVYADNLTSTPVQVTKTVHYVDEAGDPVAADGTATATFNKITDTKTGVVTYTPLDDTLEGITNPTVVNMTPTSGDIDAATGDQTVNGTDTNEDYTVVYTDNTEVATPKTITKTVHYVDEKGNPVAPDQKVSVTFTGTTDLVTGVTTYTTDNNVLAGIDDPEVAGYHILDDSPEATSAQTTTAGGSDTSYTVTYAIDPQVKTQVGTPLSVDPDDYYNNTGTPTTTTPGGDDGTPTTTTPGGDDGTPTTTTPGGDDGTPTTTTPGGDDGTPTTTTPGGNDGTPTTTTPGGDDGTPTTTTPGGDDGTPTTTTPGGDDGTPTTTTPGGDDGTPTTTTPGGDDGTPTTTTPGGDDGTPTTTTPGGDDGTPTTTTPGGDDGTPTTTTPGGDDGTPTTSTPGGDDGTPTTSTPGGDDGTPTTTTPGGDDGTPTTTTPGGDDGTPTTTTPGGDDGTPTTTTPGGDDGTPTTTTPGGDDGTPTTTTPGGDDGTPTTTTPGGNDGTPTITTPGGDDGTPTTTTPGGDDGTPTTTTPGGDDDTTTTPATDGGLTTTTTTTTTPTPSQATTTTGTPTNTTATTPARTGNGLNGQTPTSDTTTTNPDGTTRRTLVYVDAAEAPAQTAPAASDDAQPVNVAKPDAIPDQTAIIADQTNVPAADDPAESVSTVANVIDENAVLTHGNIFIAGGAPGMADYTFFSQPVMDSTTNSIDHYELLLRVWDSKQGGWHLPASFSIPASMEAHLMARAVAQLDVKDISINLTDSQFEDPDTQKAITDLAQSDAVDNLTIELATIPDTNELEANAKVFQKAGVKVTLDNLGSHTDGTQLAKAADHVDTLKVSLRGMRRDGNSLTQMRNQLAAWQQAADQHHDSVEVEGIESADELAMTNDLGITAVQGYYFSRPAMPGTRADLM